MNIFTIHPVDTLQKAREQTDHGIRSALLYALLVIGEYCIQLWTDADVITTDATVHSGVLLLLITLAVTGFYTKKLELAALLPLYMAGDILYALFTGTALQVTLTDIIFMLVLAQGYYGIVKYNQLKFKT